MQNGAHKYSGTSESSGVLSSTFRKRKLLESSSFGKLFMKGRVDLQNFLHK